MNKYVVISSNKNPDYEFYVPIVKWAWKQFGWDIITLRPFSLNGYREETVTQVMRLYAADYLQGDALLMTSDADMIPLSDYWQPLLTDITCYGHDLTGYIHQPMCYVAMLASKWREVMSLTGSIYNDMTRDLAETKAKSDNWSEWWQVDQDILTDNLYDAWSWTCGNSVLLKEKRPLVKIDRGIEPGSHLPYGRVDRAGMKWVQEHIDFHAPKDPLSNRTAINDVLLRVFGVKYERSEIFNYVNGIV
jgi:hypothetical protein